MKLFFTLLLLIPGSLFADSTPPIPLGPVKGVLVTGLTDRAKFEFSHGTLTNCERTEAGDLVFFKCDANANLTLTTDKNVTRKYSFDKLSTVYKPQKNGDVIREYNFRGSWAESGEVGLKSATTLDLWNYRSAPSDLKGFFRLDDYNVSGSVQAVQQQSH